MLGDIFEIETGGGKAYLHYIYNDKTIGDLIRVLPGLYATRPNKIEEIASLEEIFMVFFPVSIASKKKIVTKIGSYPVDNYTKPKFMRTKHQIGAEFLGWHIVDTETWKRELVQNLSSEQRKLSPWGVWNDTLLKERLVSNWNLVEWV